MARGMMSVLPPIDGHYATGPPLPKSADIVAKVENRTTQKISPKLIFGLLCRCVAFSAVTEAGDRFWLKRYGLADIRAHLS
jgi:hypothetical protein